MQSLAQTKTVLLTSLSPKGFSSIFIGFLMAVSFVMIMTLSLPTQYGTKTLNNTCAFSDSSACLSHLVQNGSNFTVKVDDIAATNQKVYIYLTYELQNAPRGRIKMSVNTALYKPKEKNKSITKYDEVKLIKSFTKKHRSFCNSNNSCEVLLASIESSKQYEDIYAVFSVNSVSLSESLGSPSLSIVYITPEFTSFEVFWRITLLTSMCCCTLFFMYVLRGIPFKQWSLEQKCTVLFMIALTISNNGFYSYEFMSANELFPSINAICDSIMLCSLLLYVLVVMDALRKPLSQRTFKFFYFPRFLIVLLIGSFLVNLYLYNAENSDPVIVMMKDPINATMAILTGLLSLIYLFWLMFAIIRSFSEARKLGEKGQRIKMYGTFTIIAIFIFFVLLLSDYFIGYRSNAAVYLTLIAYVNIYAVVLMIFYLPSTKNQNEWNNRRREIVLDDVKVTQYDDDDNELVVEENNEKNEAEILIAATNEEPTGDIDSKKIEL
ncbi:transmembrane protein [Entamoeba histolytica HM-3:IMSS]|uniref:Transmembrane protein, putative n=2 Tax=Entamoeba histolytica TaxID=5759 RepID=M2RXA9_ENTHI|nr:transmembrane protein, putative [Entamoeba histolytica KU27]EMS14867.1 transmembrane protein [Entamoeba histolytica HM-3:IMSS]